MIEIHVSTPQNMECVDSLEYEVMCAVKAFEHKLKFCRPNWNVYEISITDSYSDEACDKISELYEDAGWEVVFCYSDDNGNTILKLYREYVERDEN